MLTPFTSHFELIIPGLRVWVSLGCSPEERAHPQPVDIEIRIQYGKEPLGCRSDQLSDVCCYDTLVNQVIESLKNGSYHLIEFLASHIFDVVALNVAVEETMIEVVITKPHHPVMHVQQGIVFKYRRRAPQKSLSE